MCCGSHRPRALAAQREVWRSTAAVVEAYGGEVPRSTIQRDEPLWGPHTRAWLARTWNRVRGGAGAPRRARARALAVQRAAPTVSTLTGCGPPLCVQGVDAAAGAVIRRLGKSGDGDAQRTAQE